jgi:DNA polymerase-3 subunit gamma/tau
MDDLRIVGNENLTLEMYVMQLMHLKNIDHKQEAESELYSSEVSLETKKIPKSNNDELDSKKIKSVYKNQLKNTEQIKTSLAKSPEIKSESPNTLSIKTFEDLIQITTKEKEVELKYDLERNVKLVSFTPGKMNITFNEKLNKNFIKILTEKLLKWTGERWIISLGKEQGEETLYEKNLTNKKEKLAKEMSSEVVQDFLSAFPDAKLVDVTEDNDA